MRKKIPLILFFFITTILSARIISLDNIEITVPKSVHITNNEIFRWNDFIFKYEKMFNIETNIKIQIIFIERDKIKDDISGMNREFVSGFAVPKENTLYVLIPLKVNDFPINNLDNLICHEVIHIIIYNATDGNNIPVWLNEGLAQYLSGQYPSSFNYVIGVLFNNTPDFLPLTYKKFYKNGSFFYPYSYDFMRYIAEKYGTLKLIKFAKLFRYSQNSEKNFNIAFKKDYFSVFQEFKKGLKKKYNILTIFTPWFFMIFAAFLLIIGYIAFLIKRIREKRAVQIEENY